MADEFDKYLTSKPDEFDEYLVGEKPTGQPKKPAWVEPVKTGLETVGLLGGGLLGSGAGPGGTVVGAGLGYAGARAVGRLGEELLGYEKPELLPGVALRTGKDIGMGAGMEMGGQIAGTFLSGIYKGGEKYINRAIDWGIEKGLRPSVAGKQTSGQLKNYMEKARESVKTIIANKNELNLTDEAGNAVKGELPKNLKQFSEAISQIKKKVFTEYDTMAGQAGGSAVELRPISQELDTIVQNKVLNDLSPDIVKYAKTRSEALVNRGSYTTAEAQDAIAHLNNSLNAFYKNPSYENASKASVDSMIANRLRKGLDSTIEGAVGPGYQQLKNTYGALSSIEKDVTQRAIVDSRKNIKGLIDFSDIFSGSEVVRGILTLNPATVGTGAAAKTISSLYKHWNNPNRIVQSMFGNVEKNLIKQPRISEPTGKLLGRTGAYMGLSPQMEE